MWVAPAGALADRLTGSHWSVRLPGADLGEVATALAAFLGREVVEVQRMTKNGLRTFDARGCVVSATATPDGLDLVLAHVTPLVRPDDVLAGLVAVDPALVLADPPVLTRLAQGVLDRDTGGITDPRADRAPSGGGRPPTPPAGFHSLALPETSGRRRFRTRVGYSVLTGCRAGDRSWRHQVAG